MSGSDVPTIPAPVLVIPPLSSSPVIPSVISGDSKDQTITIKSQGTTESDRVARASEVLAAELRTNAQRKVNFIWEFTQAAIAISVVIACIAAAFLLDAAKAEILRNAFFLIVGFYFGRTNHQTSGGIGSKEPLQQSGR